MCKPPRHLAVWILACVALQAQGAPFNLGRTATPAQIAAWDIDVRPDGHGIKPGRGTVAQGQDIYEAKCASCHGTFGESNSYLVLAGGVEPEDLKRGRARRLRDADVVRTLGNKLNYATTLWDYINRAMPWPQPQSLSVDEVYAVTAYVLNLNNIVGDGFELNERSLLTLKMPNRYGMSTAHGMGSVTGKPDVQGSSCMKNCRPAPRITSELPAHASGSHGDLAVQFRTLGPYGTIKTSDEPVHGRPVATSGPVVDGQSAVVANQRARELFSKRGCVACHAVESKVLGPALREVAAQYAGVYADVAGAASQIALHIREGGVGRWGQMPMPPQPGVSAQEADDIARWIVTGAQ